MIKSPLRYPGGKSRAIKTIAPIIPDFKEYREPFLGGGSVFIYVKQKFPNKKFWINDLYSNLFYFWEHTQNNVEELIKQIYFWKNNFKNGRDLHRYLIENIENFDPLKKAAAFLFLTELLSLEQVRVEVFQKQLMKRDLPDQVLKELYCFQLSLIMH